MRTIRSERRYWALAANPKYYRILDAIRETSTDRWTTKGKAIREGDRVAIWKYRGRDRERGVVALGEVLTDPEVLADADNPYWQTQLSPDQREERVTVRYVHSARLPLWYDDDARALDHLTVSRVQGGTVYEITPSQWDELMDAIGGWPEDLPGNANNGDNNLPSDRSASRR